jgi:hypothetical protein
MNKYVSQAAFVTLCLVPVVSTFISQYIYLSRRMVSRVMRDPLMAALPRSDKRHRPLYGRFESPSLKRGPRDIADR